MELATQLGAEIGDEIKVVSPQAGMGTLMELVVQKAWLGQLFSDGYLSEKNFKSVFNALDSAEKLIKDNTFNWPE